jgi:hypothetical protein
MIISGKKVPILSIVFYVVAAIMAAFTIWAFIFCIGYISDLVSSGQLVTAGNEFNIAGYFMTNCVQYLLYTMAIFFFGFIYQFAVNHLPGNEEEADEIVIEEFEIEAGEEE